MKYDAQKEEALEAESSWLGNSIQESRIQEVGIWQLGSVYFTFALRIRCFVLA